MMSKSATADFDARVSKDEVRGFDHREPATSTLTQKASRCGRGCSLDRFNDRGSTFSG